MKFYFYFFLHKRIKEERTWKITFLFSSSSVHLVFNWDPILTLNILLFLVCPIYITIPLWRSEIFSRLVLLLRDEESRFIHFLLLLDTKSCWSHMHNKNLMNFSRMKPFWIGSPEGLRWLCKIGRNLFDHELWSIVIDLIESGRGLHHWNASSNMNSS